MKHKTVTKNEDAGLLFKQRRESPDSKEIPSTSKFYRQ
jgi:hypothetical protein